MLDNPVFDALDIRDAHLSSGTDNVKYFDETVSPFVGIREDHSTGFEELYELLPAERRILYATPADTETPKGWELLHKIPGIQMIYNSDHCEQVHDDRLVPLHNEHIDAMVELAQLTKPGPFGTGTISFGFYDGIFENDQLIAMTGQRLHPHNYTEVSAVCTHPDHLGKGYAHKLVLHQTNRILQQGHIPFLHVRADNARAIAVYERIGYAFSTGMNFYFMKKGKRIWSCRM